jgi:hypothetical protein
MTGRRPLPDFLATPFAEIVHIDPWSVLVRLLVALALGATAAWIYTRTTKISELGASFPTTLTLLTVLIAMVTQVIGDSVARAFSLVGALSIVRFRTVVRDTRDTAFVIFAVVLGMAAGAKNFGVAVLGIAVVGGTAYVMSRRRPAGNGPQDAPYLLTVRVALGFNLDRIASGVFSSHLKSAELMSVETAKQGASLENIYEVRLGPKGDSELLVRSLNEIEGVQDVRLVRRGFEN